MTSLRAWHSYLSVFVAPSVLFFALTGSLQLFGLHESRGAYTAPLVVQELGRLHKDQVFAPQEKHPQPPAPAQTAQDRPPAQDDDDTTPLSALLLKWFFLAVALALVSSTGLGLWVALTHLKRGRVNRLVFAAGALMPIALLFV
jgi:hypothetical protein